MKTGHDFGLDFEQAIGLLINIPEFLEFFEERKELGNLNSILDFIVSIEEFRAFVVNIRQLSTEEELILRRAIELINKGGESAKIGRLFFISSSLTIDESIL